MSVNTDSRWYTEPSVSPTNNLEHFFGHVFHAFVRNSGKKVCEHRRMGGDLLVAYAAPKRENRFFAI